MSCVAAEHRAFGTILKRQSATTDPDSPRREPRQACAASLSVNKAVSLRSQSSSLSLDETFGHISIMPAWTSPVKPPERIRMRQMGARSFVSFLLIVLGLSPGNEYAYAQSTAGDSRTLPPIVVSPTAAKPRTGAARTTPRSQRAAPADPLPAHRGHGASKFDAKPAAVPDYADTGFGHRSRQSAGRGQHSRCQSNRA